MTALAAFKLKAPATGNADATLGHLFRENDVPAGQYVSIDAAGASVIPLTTWPNGSLRIARIAGAFSLTAGTSKQFNLSTTSTAPSGTLLTANDIKLAFKDRTDTYVTVLGIGTVALHTAVLAAPHRTFVSSVNQVECHYHVRIPGSARLYVILHVRLYKSGRGWVSVTVGNGDIGNTTASTTVLLDYKPLVVIGGVTKFDNAANDYHHYSLARWTTDGFIGADPQVEVKHDFGYMMMTNMVPNYSEVMGQTDQATIDGWSGTTRLINQSGSGVRTANLNYVPGECVCLTPNMEYQGFQDGIGPLPNWDALLVATQGHPTFYKLSVANSFALQSFGVSWVDPTNLDPIRISDYPSHTTEGLYGGGGTTIPTLNQAQNSADQFLWECAHVPKVGPMAYWVTSDYRHLETMAFNAASAYMSFNAGYGGPGVQRAIYGQVRQQAWAESLLTMLVISHPDALESLYGDYRTWLLNAITSMQAYTNESTLTAAGSVPWLGVLDQYGQYRDGADNTAPGKYADWVAMWQSHFYANTQGYISKVKPFTSMTTQIAHRNFVLQAPVWPAGGTGPTEHNFGYLSAYYEGIPSKVYHPIDFQGILASNFNPTDPASIIKITQGFSSNPTTNTLQGTGAGAADSATGYYANWKIAISEAADAGITGAAAGWNRFINADNYSLQSVTAGYKNTPVFAITPLAHSTPTRTFTPVDSGSGGTLTTPGPSIRVDTLPLHTAGFIVTSQHGIGVPGSQFAGVVSGADATTPIYDAKIAAGGTFNPLSEYRAVPSAGTHGTLFVSDSDLSEIYTGDGSYDTVPMAYYEDGALISSAAQSFGTPPVGSTITGVSVSPTSITQATGTIQFTPTVTGTGSFSSALTRTASAGSINSSDLFTLPAQTTGVQTVTLTWTSVQDPTKSVTATVTIPAGVGVPDSAPRFARPVSDVSKGAWLPSTGTNLYAMIDEAAADAADYISAVTPTTSRIKLGAVADPNTSINQVFRYQAWSPTGGALTVRFMQGSVVIATWTHLSLPTTPSLIAQSLTSGQCDAITDYADLYVEFAAA